MTAYEVAVPAAAALGEGPAWDEAGGRLLWVDILGSAVHAYDPADGSDTVVVRTDEHVGAAKPRSAGGLVVNLRSGVGIYETGGAFRWLARLDRPGVRGNDAAVDRAGRLWAGTMAYDERPGAGRLYRIEPDGATEVVLDQVTISNGVDWSPDGTRMYYVDTPTHRVDVLDFDAASGRAEGRRPFVELGGASPDGLTVDADGGVWVALWGEGQVRHFSPEGRLERVLDFPATQTTACAFGGPGLRDLYVTSAATGVSGQPLAGCLFVVPGAGTGRRQEAFAG